MKQKQTPIDVPVTPLQPQVIEKNKRAKPGCARRIVNYIAIGVVLVFIVAALTPGKPKPPASDLPTAAQLPTDVPTAEVAVVTVAVLATNTVPAATNTSEAPTATITNTPAPTSAPTEPPTTRLENEYAGVAGLMAVDMVSVVPIDSGGYIVYSEVRTANGANFESIAGQMQQLAFGTLESASLEFNVIFNDGTRCADYTYDNGDDDWRVTPLTCPGATGQAAAPATSPAGNVLETAAETYYAESAGANLRSCPKTSCERVGSVEGGTALVINGYVDGDSVEAGNSVWYRLAYGGREAYVYSGVMSKAAPVTVQAVQPVTSGGQNQSLPPASGFTCPSNCTEAVAMGVSAQQAAQCGLDRDGDGVACYGD